MITIQEEQNDPNKENKEVNDNNIINNEINEDNQEEDEKYDKIKEIKIKREKEKDINNINEIEEDIKNPEITPIKRNRQNIICISSLNIGIDNGLVIENTEKREETAIKTDKKRAKIKVKVRKTVPKKEEPIMGEMKNKENKGKDNDFDGISEEGSCCIVLKQDGKFLIDDKEQKLKIKESELKYKLKKIKEGVDVDDEEDHKENENDEEDKKDENKEKDDNNKNENNKKK